MKLYATTTSERASKGQGGNKYIVTRFTDQDGKEWAEIRAEHTNIIQENPPLDEITLSVIIGGVKRFERKHYAKAEKGEKQKGDNSDIWVCPKGCKYPYGTDPICRH